MTSEINGPVPVTDGGTDDEGTYGVDTGVTDGCESRPVETEK